MLRTSYRRTQITRSIRRCPEQCRMGELEVVKEHRAANIKLKAQKKEKMWVIINHVQRDK